MQARFLLGPAGSGKTHRCLAEIRDALVASPEGPPLILLAPKQATFQLERQLLAGCSLVGYTRLRILFFERLAEFIFDALQIAPPKLLSEEGRLMVLRALLMQRRSELKLLDEYRLRCGKVDDHLPEIRRLSHEQSEVCESRIGFQPAAGTRAPR